MASAYVDGIASFIAVERAMHTFGKIELYAVT